MGKFIENTVLKFFSIIIFFANWQFLFFEFSQYVSYVEKTIGVSTTMFGFALTCFSLLPLSNHELLKSPENHIPYNRILLKNMLLVVYFVFITILSLFIISPYTAYLSSSDSDYCFYVNKLISSLFLAINFLAYSELFYFLRIFYLLFKRKKA